MASHHHGRFIFFMFLWACFLDQAFSAVTCLDANNKPVDWFVVYKLPRVKTATSNFKEGTGMIYMDSNLPEWKVLTQSITGKNHPIHDTLQQIYKIKDTDMPKERVYLMYNDRTPSNKVSSSKGHAKGSVCFDKKSGFWLVHSVPAFPAETLFSYPESGTVYAQTFMCVTFAGENLNSIGKQLQYMNPQLYNFNVSSNFAKDAPKLWELLNGKISLGKKANDSSNFEDLTSADGKRFASFAKSNRFGKDLYLDMVAPTLKSNLLVETWLNGNGDYPTNCLSPYTVKNVLSLNVFGMKFNSSRDHSKWAISGNTVQERNAPDDSQKGKYDVNVGDDEDDDNVGDDDDNEKLSESLSSLSSLNLVNNYFGATKTVPGKVEEETDWVCVGDINRQKSQSSRGGGTLCLKDGNVWKEFRKLIGSVEGCDGKVKVL